MRDDLCISTFRKYICSVNYRAQQGASPGRRSGDDKQEDYPQLKGQDLSLRESGEREFVLIE